MKGQLPDFDTMMQMAKDAPEDLEQLRSDCIAELLANAPASSRRRLEGLQFQIDARRSLAKSPMQSCIAISRMMHESFEQLRVTLNGSSDLSNTPVVAEQPQPEAQILSFEAPALAR